MTPCVSGSPARWQAPVRLDPPLFPRRPADRSDDFLSLPIFHEPLAFCVSHRLGVVALDTQTAKVVWTVPADPGWGACQLYQDQLLIVPRPGVLLTVDPLTGSERTSSSVEDLSLEYSAIAGGRIITPLEPGMLGAWDINSKTWSWKVPSAWNLTCLSASRDLVCVAEEHAYVGLELSTGAERWRFDVRELGRHKLILHGEREGTTVGHALMTDALVYVSVTGSLLVALDPQTGIPRWTAKSKTVSTRNFALADQDELLLLSGNALTRFDAATGTELSYDIVANQQRMNGDGPFAPMALSKGHIWTVNRLGDIVAISRTKPAVKFTHPIRGRVSRPLSIRDGELFVMDDAGKLTVLAQSP